MHQRELGRGDVEDGKPFPLPRNGPTALKPATRAIAQLGAPLSRETAARRVQKVAALAYAESTPSSQTGAF